MSTTGSSVAARFKNAFSARQNEVLTIDEYLEECRTNKLAYATPAERWLDALGEAEIVNTANDERLRRIYGNRVLRRYNRFSDFFGIEEVIEKVVDYFRFNAQGMEQSKQILYLLGPVGSAKSSLAERIKDIMETHPIYVLAARMDVDGKKVLVPSPYFCRPLNIFASMPEMKEAISEEYGIDPRYLTGIAGPWETKRLIEAKGDISEFRVIKMYPSRQERIGIANTEPGDDNNQDTSTLLGKVDIRKLEDFSQSDVDAYSFSGSLNRTTQGVMDFREMFKAPLKMLNPLLFAVQEHNYQGTEDFGSIPYDGIVLAHSNESEWGTFKGNKRNEAFLDRVCLVKVPYCIRVDEEIKVYEKYLRSSDLKNAPVAPWTLQMLATFSVLTRIQEPSNSTVYQKMRVYNGENLKSTDAHAKTFQEYKDDPENRTEGFFGFSTRSAFKLLADVFNADPEETAADPVHLLHLLDETLKKADLPEDQEKTFRSFLSTYLKPKYLEFLERDLRIAYLESYGEYGQNLFDRYVTWAEHWVDDRDLFDSETGMNLDKALLDRELQKIEKAADIANPKDFRNEVVRYCLRYSKENQGRNPDWRSYEKLKNVIEKRMFSQTEDLLPVISFAPKGSDEDKSKHEKFVQRMIEKGYTRKQVRLLVDWFQKVSKTT